MATKRKAEELTEINTVVLKYLQENNLGETAKIFAKEAKLKGVSTDNAADLGTLYNSFAQKKESTVAPATKKAKIDQAPAPASKSVPMEEDSSSSSSSESDSDSDSEDNKKKPAAPAAKAAPVAAKAVAKKDSSSSSSEDSSSDESSSSEDEKPVAKKVVAAAPAKAAATKKAASSSSSSESSSEDSSEDEKPATKPAAKAAPVAAKKAASSSSSSSSSDSSSDESSEDEKPAAKKAAPAAKPAAAVKKVSSGSDSSSSSDDSDSESSEDEKPAAPAKKAAPAAAKKKADSSSSSSSSSSGSSDESSSSEEEDEKPVIKNNKNNAATPAAKDQKNKSTIPAATPVTPTADNGKAHKIYVKGLPWQATEEEVREFFQDCGTITSCELPLDENGRSSGTAYVKFSSRSELDAALALDGQTWKDTSRWLKIVESTDKQDRKSFGAPVGERPEGCDTVFVGNLPWDVDEETMRTLFAEAGEVSNVRFATGEDGSFRGFGHVQFYNGEDTVNAIKLAGRQVNGRAIRVDYAPPRNRESFGGGAKSPAGGRGRGGFEGGRGGRGGFGGGRGRGRGGSDGGITPAKKNTGAIATGSGKKTTFDE